MSIQKVERVPRLADMAANPPKARGGSKELQRIHRLLRGRYKWACLLAVCLASAGAYFGYRVGHESYQSTGVIRIMPVIDPIIYKVADKGMMPAFDSYMTAQVSLVRSQRVLDAAKDDLEWQALRMPAAETEAAFSTAFDVTREGEMIWIKTTNRNARAAQVAAASIVRAYTKVYAEVENEGRDKRRDLLDGLKTKLANEYHGFKSQLFDLAKVYGSEDLDAQYNSKLGRVLSLESNILEMKMSLADSAKDGEATPTTAPTSRPDVLTVEEIARQDQRMAGLLSERDRWQSTIVGLRSRGFLPSHRDMQNAVSSLRSAVSAVDAYEVTYRQLHEKDAPLLPAATRAETAGLTPEQLRQKLLTYEQAYDTLKTEVLQLGQQQLQIKDIRDKAEEAKKKLDEVTDSLDQSRFEQNMSGRLVIMSEAEAPRGVFRDTRYSFAGAGGFTGTLLGFGAMILLGLVDRRLDRPDDTSDDISSAAILGVLPKLPDDFSDPEQAAMAVHSVHGVRTRLQLLGQVGGEGYAADGSLHQVFSVTGPVAGTGKTSLTLALGVSFAAAKLRTLMIDGDVVGGGLTARTETIVRRKIGRILQRDGILDESQLHEALKLARGSGKRLGEILVELGHLSEDAVGNAVVAQENDHVGLLDALTGEELSSCVAETGVDGLFVLPIGEATAQHVGWISPDSVRRLIQSAREQFDIVLFDTGPTPASLEASVIASQVDSVVLVVSRGEQRPYLQRSLAQLGSVGARVAGVVFNRAKSEDLDPAYRSSRPSGSRSARGGSKPKSTNPDGKPEAPAPGADRFGPIGQAVASAAPSTSGGSRPGVRPSSSSNDNGQ